MIYFVTPAYKRYELSEVCFAQRQYVIEDLARRSIEAHCVVIADDENIDIALSAGFEIIEQNNDGLGRKWNDGTEYAARQGADWIVPIGSDSWVDSDFFRDLPSEKITRTSGLYAVVEKDRLAECNVTNPRLSAGPYVFHRSLLEASGFRPCDDDNSTNTDHSTLAGIGRHRIQWEHRDLHPLQYVGFRMEPMMTSYASLWRKWGVTEHTDPWTHLKTRYPDDLVDKARKVMEEQA